MNALILRSFANTREVIPTRVNGCTNFIPIGISPAIQAEDTCTLNCIIDSTALGNTDPTLASDCRACCASCVEQHNDNPTLCNRGCAIGGEGGPSPTVEEVLNAAGITVETIRSGNIVNVIFHNYDGKRLTDVMACQFPNDFIIFAF